MAFENEKTNTSHFHLKLQYIKHLHHNIITFSITTAAEMPVSSACPAPAWLPVCRQHQHRPKDMAVGAGCLCWWKRRVTCGWGARGNPGKIWINCRLRLPCPPMQCSVVVSCLLRVSTCLVAWAAWSIVFDHFYNKREKTTGPVCWLWWNEWKTVHCSKICQRYVKHFVVDGLETVLILVVPFQRGEG